MVRRPPGPCPTRGDRPPGTWASARSWRTTGPPEARAFIHPYQPLVNGADEAHRLAGEGPDHEGEPEHPGTAGGLGSHPCRPTGSSRIYQVVPRLRNAEAVAE